MITNAYIQCHMVIPKQFKRIQIVLTVMFVSSNDVNKLYENSKKIVILGFKIETQRSLFRICILLFRLQIKHYNCFKLNVKCFQGLKKFVHNYYYTLLLFFSLNRSTYVTYMVVMRVSVVKMMVVSIVSRTW